MTRSHKTNRTAPQLSQNKPRAQILVVWGLALMLKAQFQALGKLGYMVIIKARFLARQINQVSTFQNCIFPVPGKCTALNLFI